MYINARNVVQRGYLKVINVFLMVNIIIFERNKYVLCSFTFYVDSMTLLKVLKIKSLKIITLLKQSVNFKNRFVLLYHRFRF